MSAIDDVSSSECFLRVALACVAVTIASCGSPAGDVGGADQAAPTAASAREQPPDGVPAGTFPLPLPEKGKPYNNPQPRSNIRDGGTLTLPTPELGPNFNIHSADGNTNYLRRILNWVAPRLWDFSVTGEASPNQDYLLSAELISENPETVKYTLNPNARWNDGAPIDWTAFEATWITQRGDDPRFAPAATDGYRSIGSVAKGEKDNEVIVTFKEPFYPFELVFIYLEHPKNADSTFYATGWLNELPSDLLAGPFMVASLTEERLVLTRNPRWWGDTPKLDTVIYRRMEDLATVNAFQNGEVDSTTITGGRATADQLEQISRMTDAQIRRANNTVTAVYTMGQDSELFKDEAARKGFVLGTDRELLVELRFQGMSWKEEAPGSALVFPWQDGYRDNIADLRYDPEHARRVLDGAGWKLGADGYRYKDGKIAEFTYVAFGDEPTFTAMARAQQKMAKDIGLKMEIDLRKSSDFSRTLSDGTFDVVAMSWASEDPFGYAQSCQIFCSGSESNYSRLGNAQIDEQLKRVTTIRDRSQAFEALNEAESSALHLLGTFPIYSGPSQFAVRKGLANFGPAGFMIPSAEDIGWQK